MKLTKFFPISDMSGFSCNMKVTKEEQNHLSFYKDNLDELTTHFLWLDNRGKSAVLLGNIVVVNCDLSWVNVSQSGKNCT